MMKHLAIIPDGNRRWARTHGLPTLEGHRRGYDKFKEVGEWCLTRGIEYISFWGFSTENWKRTEEEVSYLMDLILRAVTSDGDFYKKNNIRLRVIGRRDELPKAVVEAAAELERATANNTRGTVNLCVNYGGHAEILDAVKRLIADGRKPEEITDELFSQTVWLAASPPPDLIVRTSGEKRLSGFMSWSGAYSELAFIDKHWPDFEEADLDALIADFEKRNRRFGGN